MTDMGARNLDVFFPSCAANYDYNDTQNNCDLTSYDVMKKSILTSLVIYNIQFIPISIYYQLLPTIFILQFPLYFASHPIPYTSIEFLNT